MLKEFKEFALKGNVLDLAIAVVMGANFQQDYIFISRKYHHAINW